MKEKPILFSSPMVWAILAGHKTQTRRIIKPQPGMGWSADCNPWNVDQLWVKETFAFSGGTGIPGTETVHYAADNQAVAIKRWKPSIFMPRWASRITLHIQQLGIQWIHNINDIECRREGIIGDGFGGYSWPNAPDDVSADSPKEAFKLLWQSIHGPESWAANPAVWIIVFTPEVHSCK